ncbi:MAG: thiamine biosynthesis protein ThiC [Hyphomonadaceae bacterium]
MELSQARTVKIVGILLLLAVISQTVFTALYVGPFEISPQFIWQFEGLLFVVLAAVAGSALVMAKRYTLGFSAIAFSALLNIIQLGIGFTQFGPFGEAAAANADLQGIQSAVAALSFFLYNAAKVLLGLAAIVFGMAKMNQGSKAIGGLTALVGVVAFVANALVMMFGLQGFVPSPVAGGSGVAATLLVSICLLTLGSDD